MSSSGEPSLVCNSRGCLSKIEDAAWITYCSHVFCPEHGRELRQRYVADPELSCPCCGSPFRSDLDLLERKLNYPAQFRAMQLCGYSPEVVMEIATVAIAFWNFQKQQISANLGRKCDFYKESLAVARKERDSAEAELRRAKLELERTQDRNRELERNKVVAPIRNKRGGGYREPVMESKKRRGNEDDDFLI